MRFIQKEQMSHKMHRIHKKDQVHVFWKNLNDLAITIVILASCFVSVTYVLYVADRRL
jgi:hypothetical protein